MKLPAHIYAFVLAALVLVLSTVLIATGHAVPTWWTWIGTAAIAGGLGLSIPSGITITSGSGTTSTPTSSTTTSTAAPASSTTSTGAA
jgi:NAD(P)H-dependent flavin oxidoreductase YrpB (nitropropane dioxygenase family)